MTDTKTSGLTDYVAPIGADMFPMVDTINGTLKGMRAATAHWEYANQSTSQQGAGFAADTYLAGSNIPIPNGAPYVGTAYHAWFDVTKTAAGTATPIITLRIGTAGSTSDAAICTFTFGAGTAAVDVGQFEIHVVFRTVGSGTSAVVQGICNLTSNLTTTGLSNAKKAVVVTSAGFNSTTASLIIGASYNGGTSASHTIQLVRSELML